MSDRSDVPGELPTGVNALRLADENARLTGMIPLIRLARLGQNRPGQRPSEAVEVDLAFSRGRDGVRRLAGTARATVQTRCERCGETYDLVIEAHPGLVLVAAGGRCGSDAGGEGAGAEDSGAEDDRIEVTGLLSLHDLIEDELLLAMPMFPCHPEGSCVMPVRQR